MTAARWATSLRGVARAETEPARHGGSIMPRPTRRERRKVGLPPGTIEFTGERKVDQVKITLFAYDADSFTEQELTSIAACAPYRESPRVAWINIDGLHDTALLQELGQIFGLHPLALEDIVATHQRPKVDEYPEHLYVVLRTLTSSGGDPVGAEQLSLILGPRYVLSFQERETGMFNPVRERIRNGKGRSRRMGPDYLAYALIDAVVDSYFTVLEHFGQRIDALDEQIVEDPSPARLRVLHELKREALLIRKCVWPLREVISRLERMECGLIRPEMRVFLRDVYDHIIQVLDTFETYRDMLVGLQELYLSSVSNRLNEVMKVLTIIATIFAPITFAAGVYGMNFKFMPELGWRWAYPLFWAVMVVVTAIMLRYFRRKRWL